MLHQHGAYGKRSNLHGEQPRSVVSNRNKFESSLTVEHTEFLFKHSELCWQDLKKADEYRDEILAALYVKDAKEWLATKMAKNRSIIIQLKQYEKKHPSKYGNKSNGKEPV